jgi:plastocyanin
MDTYRTCALLAMLASSCIPLRSETIEGKIIVKKTLTRRRVTALVPFYERGPVVALGHDAEGDDPIAFERSRVVVYLEGRVPKPTVTVPPLIARIEQKDRRFTTETLVIQAGSKVSFPNFDPIFHNVFSLSRTKVFDLGNYSMGETRVVTFNEPGIVYVNCHLHSNMTATIVVAPNQWNVKVNRDGTFELHDVPPGKYTIIAWHKAAGSFRQPVEVVGGHGAHIEFLIPLEIGGPESGAGGHPAKRPGGNAL